MPLIISLISQIINGFFLERRHPCRQSFEKRTRRFIACAIKSPETFDAAFATLPAGMPALQVTLLKHVSDRRNRDVSRFDRDRERLDDFVFVGDLLRFRRLVDDLAGLVIDDLVF